MVDLTDVPITPLVEANGTIYVSGQIPIDGDRLLIDEDVGTQTTKTLKRIESLLISVGSSKDEIVKTIVFLSDVKRDFESMNEAYAQFFGEPYPARTTVGADIAVDVLVEIEAVAVRR